MSLFTLFSKGPSGFGYRSTAEQVTDGLSLTGKTVLVTGCNSGLGYETLRVLALRGARVVGTARTLDKATAACESVAGLTVPFACELAEPESVRACVAGLQQRDFVLDAILCNAGIMALPKLRQAFGYELQFFTNHIGHFMLVTGLLDRLSDDGRVVVLSSEAHTMAPKDGIEFDNLDGGRGYAPWRNYAQSKLANLLFAKELSRRLQASNRTATANALHPGIIATGLGRNMLDPVSDYVFRKTGPLVLKSRARRLKSTWRLTRRWLACRASTSATPTSASPAGRVGTPRWQRACGTSRRRSWPVSRRAAL
jgi:WW domain-containing oxidoreductase